MADKQINLKVVADGDYSDIETLEQKINKLKNEKLNFRIEADNSKIVSIDEEIARLKSEIKDLSSTPLDVKTNMNEINKLVDEIEKLEAEKVDIQLDIETAELEKVKDSIRDLEKEEVEVQLRNQTAMEAIGQIADGFSRLKQGAMEVGQEMSELLASAGKQETNFTFLKQALNNDEALAKQKMQDINQIVQDLPGDDTAVQGLLSQAIAKDADISTDVLSSIGTAYADYASAMSFYGKTSTEAQQDMNNYILAGNTRELELSPILASHVDKLKEGKDVRERALLLQEALEEEHWGGISKQNTYNNKLETFNGMLERGKYNLGGMFQEGAKGAMDFLLKLDDTTGGLVGMTIALGGFASPLTDAVLGIGQMATGLNSLKELGIIQWFKDLEIVTKLSAFADWLLAGAQQVLNFVMYENPIILVVLALALLVGAIIWAYYNVDWFREMVDGAWQSLVQFGEYIYGSIAGAIQWLGDIFNQFTQELGLDTNDWTQAILGFILFLPQLPLRVGQLLLDTIAKVLGFGDNFTQNMFNAGMRAVNNFIQWISQIPQKLGEQLNNALNKVQEWASTLPQKFWEAGVNAVKNFLNALDMHSPGTMQRMLIWEITEMGKRVPDESRNLIRNIGSMGDEMVDAYGTPQFNSPTIQYTKPEFANDSLADLTAILNNQNMNGDIIINHYGDVDNDERQKKMVEAILRELHWNNKTAGRTV